MTRPAMGRLVPRFGGGSRPAGGPGPPRGAAVLAGAMLMAGAALLSFGPAPAQQQPEGPTSAPPAGTVPGAVNQQRPAGRSPQTVPAASPGAGATRPGRPGPAPPAPAPAPAPAASQSGVSNAGDPFLTRVRAAIEKHLGRPYVWGATGLKSFDCSGFLWRVMAESGMLTKRTTARKYYMSLKKIPQEGRWGFATLVFFDNLKHCGIVNDSESFYHAAVTLGTHRSDFDPYWRRRIYGFRRMPLPLPAGGVAPPVAPDPPGPSAQAAPAGR